MEGRWHNLASRSYPKFLAKTQVVEGQRKVGKPIVIRALSSIVNRADEERRLCPVRAVKFYLNRVKKFRGGRKKLFISYQKNYEEEIVKSQFLDGLKRLSCCGRSWQKKNMNC